MGASRTGARGVEMTSRESSGSFAQAISDGAGVVGAIAAALCCAGTPLIVGALGAVGLSFLRKDAILWPVMLASLLVALWGFVRGFRSHRKVAPMALGTAGAVSLACGVMLVHGPAAMPVIYGGALALVVATIWNVWARRSSPALVRLRT